MGTPVEASSLKGVICEETVRLCLQAYGEQLRGIVLTGSLARDEATCVGIEGQWRLWGDAEFFLVFHDHANLPSAEALKGLVGEVESSLLQRKARCQIGLSAVQTRYFRRLRPHIFAYELRTWGKAIWGDSKVLALIPEFDASEIPLEDAWRLLCNRVIEQLEIVPGAAEGAEDGWRNLRYRTAKLYLDMATSYLVFRGAYSPSYRERSEALSRLMEETPTAEKLPFSLRDFTDRVAASTRFKLTGSFPEASFLALPESNPNFWKESLSIALGLWRWELARLAGVHGNRSDRDLMREWMRQQPFSKRLRGWLYVARQEGWVRSWANWPRWARLAWHGSPRYWVYEATMELTSRLVRSEDDLCQALNVPQSWQEPLGWLPSRGRLAGEHVDCRVVASEIAWNYHAYLEKTQA